VAIDDVADAVARLALAPDPPALVEFGGPEALTRREADATWTDAPLRALGIEPRSMSAFAAAVTAARR
jgi:uncharacterized protein YbjT (DUF2867 family)